MDPLRAKKSLGILEELSSHRGLLWSLAWRDVRVRYKQSALGIAWAVLLPFSMMLVFAFVFTRAIDGRAALGIEMPYPLYAFAGLVPWTFLSTSLTGCVNSLTANRNLVTKVYFPREVFPFASVLSSFVDFLIALGVLLLLMVYFSVTGAWTLPALGSVLLFLPVVIAVQMILMAGIGMVLAMGNLFYRDVRQLFGVAVQLWMFVSGVVVPVPRDGSMLAQLLVLNPVVPLINAYRACLLHGQFPPPAEFAYVVLVALTCFGAGWLVFRRASFRFAECI